MLFIISLPCRLSSKYFSLKSVGVISRKLATASFSCSVTFIINCLQQAPHVVQSICAVIFWLMRCTVASKPSLFSFCKKVLKASFSASFVIAFCLIISLSVIKFGNIFCKNKACFLFIANCKNMVQPKFCSL